jgi:organic hydroperoxide reductase OsmC/OhrA
MRSKNSIFKNVTKIVSHTNQKGFVMQYTSTLTWNRHDLPFTAKTYDRTHHLTFGGGVSIEASSAAEFLGKAALPNPEELFTASISSCFMLTFLYLAAMKGVVIDTYQAEATATLAKNAEGKMAVTEVIIKPRLAFHENKHPDATLLDELFKKAHENCFISSSVKSNVKVEYQTTATA